MERIGEREREREDDFFRVLRERACALVRHAVAIVTLIIRMKRTKDAEEPISFLTL